MYPESLNVFSTQRGKWRVCRLTQVTSERYSVIAGIGSRSVKLLLALAAGLRVTAGLEGGCHPYLGKCSEFRSLTKPVIAGLETQDEVVQHPPELRITKLNKLAEQLLADFRLPHDVIYRSNLLPIKQIRYLLVKGTWLLIGASRGLDPTTGPSTRFSDHDEARSQQKRRGAGAGPTDRNVYYRKVDMI